MSPLAQTDAGTWARVTLYTRRECHLCAAARQVIAPVVSRFGVSLLEKDVDSPETDPLLRAHYDHAVPVLHVNDIEIARHRIEPATLEQALAWASFTVVVMGKYPTPGRVKTRLCGPGSPFTPEQAAEVHRIFLVHLLTRLGRMRPARLLLAFDPPEAGAAFETLLLHLQRPGPLATPVELMPQVPGNLGDRLVGVREAIHQRGGRRGDGGSGGGMLFFGCDSPDLPDSHLDAVVTNLLAYDTTVGPTTDGGYWTLGCREGVNLTKALESVPWSSGQELAATVNNLERCGYRCRVAETWDDVDYPSDLIKLLQRLRNSEAPQDKRLLQQLERAGIGGSVERP